MNIKISHNCTTPAVNLKPLALLIGIAISVQVQAQDTKIEQVDVVGSRAGLQNAIQKQRNSDKIAGVVDSDAIGNFADINVSESLRRISGIMVENDQGEGRYVSVRGMNTDLNAMTINGVSTAAPEDRRGIMLDGVPTDMLDSMTVYKTLTPNLDADTIGGAIDLETISAFKYDDSFIRVKAETSYNELTEDGSNPSLSATFTRRFDMADGELGAALIVSDQTRRIQTHNNETGGWSATAPNNDYEMRFYDLTRDRSGVVFNLDYLASSGLTLYAHMFHNEYTDTEYRGKWETRDGLGTVPVINGSTYTYASTKMDNEARDRKEKRTISSMQVGTELILQSGSTMKLELFGSRAEQDDTDQVNAVYRSGTIKKPLVYDNSNPKKPVLSYAPEFYDAANFKLKAFEVEKALTTDRDVGARFDMTMALNADTEMRYGLKYRQREKRNDFNYCGYEPVSAPTLADVGALADIPVYLDSLHGPEPSGANARSFLGKLGAGSVSLSDGTVCQSAGTYFGFSGDEDAESVPADWQTDEDVLSAYVMATTNTGAATWVYGLRYEDTRNTYRGKSLVNDVYAGATSYDNDYGFAAPSLNVKFDVNDTQVARLGIFRSLVRPGFNESRAGAIIDVEDNQIEGGNPGLDPASAWNFDLSYEFYLGNDTFFSAGVFYKSIKDSVVEVDAANITLRGASWSRARTFINTDSSSIAGIETSFQTAMENGLIFVVNYTHTDGDTDLPANSISGQRTIPYFKQAKDTANTALGYNKDAWDIRLAANYRSDYLDALGADALSDRYTSAYMQVDLTAKYQINEQLLLTASALNLNDRPEYYYFGNESRLSQYDEYGTTYGLGLRYQF